MRLDPSDGARRHRHRADPDPAAQRPAAGRARPLVRQARLRPVPPEIEAIEAMTCRTRRSGPFAWFAHETGAGGDRDPGAEPVSQDREPAPAATAGRASVTRVTVRPLPRRTPRRGRRSAADEAPPVQRTSVRPGRRVPGADMLDRLGCSRPSCRPTTRRRNGLDPRPGGRAGRDQRLPLRSRPWWRADRR